MFGSVTWNFVIQIVDEAYGIADQSWIDATESTPAGMTLTQLQAQMEALRTSDAGAPFEFGSGPRGPAPSRKN